MTRLQFLLALAAPLTAAAPGKGKHIVLISGDEEYRSEEALPQLAKILTTHHGFRCTVLYAIDKKDGTINPNQADNIQGLEALAPMRPAAVLVHDAARPLVDAPTIARVTAALEHAPGAIAAVALTDTLKRGEGGRIAGTMDRAGLWRAQTPQGFRFEAAVTTIAPSDAAKRRVTRTRMGDFIAVSVTNNLRAMVDSPNVPRNQALVVSGIQSFPQVLTRNAGRAPATSPPRPGQRAPWRCQQPRPRRR